MKKRKHRHPDTWLRRKVDLQLMGFVALVALLIAVFNDFPFCASPKLAKIGLTAYDNIDAGETVSKFTRTAFYHDDNYVGFFTAGKQKLLTRRFSENACEGLTTGAYRLLRTANAKVEVIYYSSKSHSAKLEDLVAVKSLGDDGVLIIFWDQFAWLFAARQGWPTHNELCRALSLACEGVTHSDGQQWVSRQRPTTKNELMSLVAETLDLEFEWLEPGRYTNAELEELINQLVDRLLDSQEKEVI